MLFNSVAFAIFLPIIFILYWFLTGKNLRIQNVLLLISSFFFYSYWDYRFLLLLILSISLDFVVAKKIHNAEGPKKRLWFLTSIIFNLAILFFFKYFNFFIESFSSAFGTIGIPINVSILNLILPLGISFYTFHELSYITDIYREKVKPVENYVDYALFVSFFPLLVAGPIERATHLLPQIQKKRYFNYSQAVNGLRQLLWGYFKKVVIADNCAEVVNSIFNNTSTSHTGSAYFIGAVFFSFQIYCDFSGYSDIALGTARLFGFELLKNFNYPYFSRDIAEFWRRWHISLTTWFRDYVYIPLGGNKGSTWIRVRNTFLIFLISGFWHGANWTFIVWGLLNAVYFLPLLLLKKNRSNLEIVAKGRNFPTLKETLSIIITFILTTLAWIFFRAENMTAAISYISAIFSPSLITLPHLASFTFNIYALDVLILLFLLIEWAGREQNFALETLFVKSKRFIRWPFYIIIIITIAIWSKDQQQQFIYFHF
ncbi:MBOAT family protein [Mucilaginibacter sp. SG564]|uniref:MBOAT family O-acyltransferase n=1 Tax=Mucilaginibacter sp. SG564 TaxID=2587022 RepID=UPI001551DE1B|nr:MBOAT family protein [Mucilaginibacter sp. SG564]NOW98921.1 D-alanyl-lipoteichoic acid acyltransferase DltB (MBOAT superfamily) [Mucilaginibacter sp. SG564]